MIFTLCWDEYQFTKDIKINPEQKIVDTLLILVDGGVLSGDLQIENIYIFSKRRNENIDVKLSYESANIQNGDILYIKKKE